MSSVKEEFEKSDVIIVGKILSKQVIEEKYHPIQSYFDYSVQYTIKLDRLYKGDWEGDTILVKTGFGEGNGDCGYNFRLDSTYIVYAYYEEHRNLLAASGSNELKTDVCTRTTLYQNDEIIGLDSIVCQKR